MSRKLTSPYIVSPLVLRSPTTVFARSATETTFLEVLYITSTYIRIYSERWGGALPTYPDAVAGLLYSAPHQPISLAFSLFDSEKCCALIFRFELSLRATIVVKQITAPLHVGEKSRNLQQSITTSVQPYLQNVATIAASCSATQRKYAKAP